FEEFFAMLDYSALQVTGDSGVEIEGFAGQDVHAVGFHVVLVLHGKDRKSLRPGQPFVRATGVPWVPNCFEARSFAAQETLRSG
ncbi:MAG: hypothetical protein WAL55_07785, partial [Candidatus Acidiferrales bacterium]